MPRLPKTLSRSSSVVKKVEHGYNHFHEEDGTIEKSVQLATRLENSTAVELPCLRSSANTRVTWLPYNASHLGCDASVWASRPYHPLIAKETRAP
jgi:hypothetical protein